MDKHITLTPEDPTIFASCPRCNKRGRGVVVGNYYSKAFTPRRWRRNPVCENCGTPLVKLFEVELEA